MAVELYDASDNDGLFDLLGKAFYAQQITDTHTGTTIPAEIVDIVTAFRLRPVEMELQNVILGITSAHDSLKLSGEALSSRVSEYCKRLVIEMVHDDNSRVNKDLASCLEELIQQMKDATASVDASTVTATVSAAGGNTGDGVLVVSTKRPDGRMQENAIAESLVGKCTAAGSSPTFEFKGEASATPLDVDWPLGSGISASFPGNTSTGGILLNSGFNDEDDVANAPDDWQVTVGTVGTHLAMTDVETQTIAISGTPTGGTYRIDWSNTGGKSEQTLPLAYNAGAQAVQDELRKFFGLGLVEVSTAGTTPNLTHTIEFVGVGGDMSQFTSTSDLTGGSPVIGHATTAGGASQVISGSKAFKWLTNGSTLTSVQQNIRSRVQPTTAYAVNGFVMRGASSLSTGVVTVDLVDGVGGSVINDDEGTANSFTFNLSSLTASWKTLTLLSGGETVFRTPTILPDLINFRFRQTTAGDASREVYFDEWAMVPMTRLYPGGPYATLFAGPTDFEIDDKITLAVTNDRAGLLQEWYNRNFDMAGKDLLLPSHSGGSETIPDTVVS